MRATRTVRHPTRPLPAPAVIEARPSAGEERRLLAHLRSGAPAAVDLLIACHAGRVYRVALGITGRADRAEQVVRAVFVRILSWTGNIDGPETLRRHLYRVATEEALGQETDSVRVGPPSGRGRGPAALDRAMLALSARDRAALILHDGEGLSAENVADGLGERVAMVRARVHRARLALAGRHSADRTA